MRKHKIWLTLGMALTSLMASHQAHAMNTDALSKATLTTAFESVTCTLTTPSGTTPQPCDPNGWTVRLEEGWSASMVVTIAYTYSDDGLQLPPNGPGYQGTSGAYVLPVSYGDRINPLNAPRATHEAAAFTVRRGGICLEGCDPLINYTGTGLFENLFYSNNTFAESVSGTVQATSSASIPNLGVGFGSTVTCLCDRMSSTSTPCRPRAVNPSQARFRRCPSPPRGS